MRIYVIVFIDFSAFFLRLLLCINVCIHINKMKVMRYCLCQYINKRTVICGG